MHRHRQELVRLFRVALDRPRWQWVLAFAVSVWTLLWIGGQFTGSAPSALGVLEVLGGAVGVAAEQWTTQVAAVWHGAGAWPPVAGGLLWAATSERGQTPALLGWIAVMLGSERLGYRPAVLIAVATLVGFAVLIGLLSLTTARFVDRRSTLLPRDVLRASVTAATLSVVVPLVAPAAAIIRLGRPYITRAPRVLTPESGASGRGGWSRIPEQAKAPEQDRAPEPS
ncbi:hypothetical protein [Saccharopolyspora taberi]|uniref:Uncharacterized protein n=1 Tax=Saccharopolyspora taberi TaxID=60895 RepID=A0ABN3V3U7_9PSEU